MARMRVQRVPRNVPFNDHTGKTAWMSWTSYSDQQTDLPSLAWWVFYMVNPDITPESFNGHDFKRGLEALGDVTDCYHFHYEFFFLPNASIEECVAHYRGEMSARGTMWDQIREVAAAKEIQSLQNEPREDSREEVGDDMTAHRLSANHKEPYGDQVKEGQRLPGLIWPLQEPGDICSRYKGGLFVYPHADVNWEGTDASTRKICLVNFDPIPVSEKERSDGTVIFDRMEHPVHPQWLPAAPSPENRRRRERRLNFERHVTPESDNSLLTWMDGHGRDHWRLEARDATHDAINMGWQSW